MSIKQTDTFSITLVDESYFYVIIKNDIEFEIDDIIKLVNFQKELGRGKKYPVLVNPSLTANTNSDTIRYLSKNINLPYTIADAFIISSVGHKILAKIYTKIISTQRPTGFFTTKEEALSWLEQHIPKE